MLFIPGTASWRRTLISPGRANGPVEFIGPGSEAIELMGSKRRSKDAMLAAGVPCIAGYHGSAQSDNVLLEKAAEIGFPLMVKASAGGGGRGLRLVTEGMIWLHS
jgi:geranyl-CoA carboxylase alpha subunit